jgi:hypothetical protein
MSGGYFDRNVYAIGEIADSIERDIARALRPKPEKIQNSSILYISTAAATAQLLPPPTMTR